MRIPDAEFFRLVYCIAMDLITNQIKIPKDMQFSLRKNLGSAFFIQNKHVGRAFWVFLQFSFTFSFLSLMHG